MKRYGLIGYPLEHSFSPVYFQKKWKLLGLTDYSYELFPLRKIDELPSLLSKNPGILGLNVTIPFKKDVLRFVDYFSDEVSVTKSANTLKIIDGKIYAYNTDVFGFSVLLEEVLVKNGGNIPQKALVFGTGGAAQSVIYVLQRKGIEVIKVSRSIQKAEFTYQLLTKKIFDQCLLIVNTTPVGMFPHEEEVLPINFSYFTPRHIVIDLVYNPLETKLMKQAKQWGAQVYSGLKMLYAQADRSWQIWNDNCLE
jgi:shikimate dehydrogenase